MRRRRAVKREVIPDTKYNSKLVARLIGIVMLKGKRSLAERIVYSSIELAAKAVGSSNGLEVVDKAISNVRPHLEVRPRRVGGATYQVPMEVPQERGIQIALCWIRDLARKRKGKPMEERLSEELQEAYKGTGQAMKKREDTHKMAEANKAFAHYRW